MSNEIKFIFDPDHSCLEFFVNGELFCTWTCEDQSGLRDSVKTFNKIYKLGISEQARRTNEIKKEVILAFRDELSRATGAQFRSHIDDICAVTAKKLGVDLSRAKG